MLNKALSMTRQLLKCGRHHEVEYSCCCMLAPLALLVPANVTMTTLLASFVDDLLQLQLSVTSSAKSRRTCSRVSETSPYCRASRLEEIRNLAFGGRKTANCCPRLHRQRTASTADEFRCWTTAAYKYVICATMTKDFTFALRRTRQVPGTADRVN